MHHTPPTIRPYHAGNDLDALVALWDQASRRGHGFLGEAHLQRQKHQLATEWLPAAETHVAVVDGHPAGFISLLDRTVGGLFVSPAFQRRGIGQRLIAHALALKGELDLDVYADNADARRFYAALGFRQTGQSPHDREGLPFPILSLSLSPQDFTGAGVTPSSNCNL